MAAKFIEFGLPGKPKATDRDIDRLMEADLFGRNLAYAHIKELGGLISCNADS